MNKDQASSTLTPAAVVPATLTDNINNMSANTNEASQSSVNVSTGIQPAISNQDNAASNEQVSNSDEATTTQVISQPDAGQQSSVPSLVSSNSDAGSQSGFYVSPEEFALIQEAKELKLTKRLDEKVKLHSKTFPSRRITVALRRIDLKQTAPDNDVVAYIEVCNLKAVAGKKSEASEQEMSAYLQLFSQGVEPSLPAIEQIVNN